MPDFDKMKKQTRSGGGPFNMKSYGAGKNPISRKGKINPKSDSNLEDDRDKSSAFQNIYGGCGSYKKPGSKKSKKIV